MPKKTVATSIEQTINLPPLDLREITVDLVGDSALISHAWSEKAKKQILDKQTKKAKQGREARDPERDFRDSLYTCADGSPGFPAVAFKSAAVDACSHVTGVTKVLARGAFHIIGDMVKIDGTATPREDMVRVGMGAADIRFRGEFKEWKATLRVRYNAAVLSPEQIVNLFNTAGFAIGVGEWRPQRDGSFGMFHVATED
jgi:hypothetical protein